MKSCRNDGWRRIAHCPVRVAGNSHPSHRNPAATNKKRHGKTKYVKVINPRNSIGETRGGLNHQKCFHLKMQQSGLSPTSEVSKIKTKTQQHRRTLCCSTYKFHYIVGQSFCPNVHLQNCQRQASRYYLK